MVIAVVDLLFEIANSNDAKFPDLNQQARLFRTNRKTAGRRGLLPTPSAPRAALALSQLRGRCRNGFFVDGLILSPSSPLGEENLLGGNDETSDRGESRCVSRLGYPWFPGNARTIAATGVMGGFVGWIECRLDRFADVIAWAVVVHGSIARRGFGVRDRCLGGRSVG
jgi:hypothetical protein